MKESNQVHDDVTYLVHTHPAGAFDRCESITDKTAQIRFRNGRQTKTTVATCVPLLARDRNVLTEMTFPKSLSLIGLTNSLVKVVC